MAANHVTENFDHQSFRTIPLVPEETGELNLTQLRWVLQCQARSRDARLVLSFEIGFLPTEDAKQEACRSLIEACNHADEKKPIWAIESTARSMLAQSLRRAGNTEIAEMETDVALGLLK